MLSFFPSPYPDEILYSILARYHIRSGNISPKLTLQELFNSSNAIATAALPCNLTAIAANLSLISNITVQELIQHHTLYPFYAAFLPKERSRQVFKTMQSEYGGGIHGTVGIRASAVPVPKCFRFCPQCIQTDQEQYGELYWHRIHQVPGVLVCPDHAEVLQESSVVIQGFNRHEYYAASIDNCVNQNAKATFSEATLQTLRLLAQDACFLLTHPIPARDLNWFAKQYRTLLIDRGLATATERVHQRELLNQFLCFYGEQVLEALDSALNPDDEHNWLSSIVRKHRKAFHPIRHLLMIRFLGISIEEFFKSKCRYQPFGQGPWLCLNAAAEHYLKPAVTQLAISHCCDTKKPVGTFSCSCGFVYCRTGPDQTEEDFRRIGKIKAVGVVWQQKLRQLVEVERVGLRETARRLKVDPNTITRYVKLLNLSPRWQASNEDGNLAQETSSVEQSPLNEVRTQYREAWQDLQQQHQGASKTALRRMAPAVYAWLYRNDRQWLEQNSPQARQPLAQNHRVNWQERDEQILAVATQAVNNFLVAEKPIRITVSRVAKGIGQLALIEQHIDKLPLTKAYLDSVVETIEDFQVRRVQWAAKQLDRQGESIEYWKVIRIAGLRPNYSEKVGRAIDQAVQVNSGNLSTLL